MCGVCEPHSTCMSGDLEYRYVAVEGRRAAEIKERRSVLPTLPIIGFDICYCCIIILFFYSMSFI